MWKFGVVCFQNVLCFNVDRLTVSLLEIKSSASILLSFDTPFSWFCPQQFWVERRGGVYRPYKDKDAIGSTREVLLAGFDGERPENGLEIHVAEEDLKDLPRSAESDVWFRFPPFWRRINPRNHGNLGQEISKNHPKLSMDARTARTSLRWSDQHLWMAFWFCRRSSKRASLMRAFRKGFSKAWINWINIIVKKEFRKYNILQVIIEFTMFRCMVCALNFCCLWPMYPPDWLLPGLSLWERRALRGKAATTARAMRAKRACEDKVPCWEAG